MTATYVTLILDRYDGAGNPLVSGGGAFTPSQDFPDVADQMLVGQSPVPFTFRSGSLPTVKVIANDTAGPQGETLPGWTWNLTYNSNTPGSPAAASYYILSTNGTTQYLSSLASTPAAQPGALFVPLPQTAPTSASQMLGLSSDSPLVTEWVDQSGPQLQATTGAEGFALVDGTPEILTWTAPDDGQLHRVTLFAAEDVISAMTGGYVQVAFTMPDGTPYSYNMINGDVPATGFNGSQYAFPVIIKAGSTVTLSQSGALTGGAATLWAEIWGS